MGGYGSNDFGPMHAKEILNKYAAQEAQINHKVLMITINKIVTELIIINKLALVKEMSKEPIFISGPIGESFLARKNKSYHLPETRNTLGVLLPEYANCCTDMSDGILESVNNISKKSHVGVKINIDKIPRNEKLDLLISNKKPLN